MALFPDLSGLAQTGEALSQQFGVLVSLLQKISDDTAAIRAHIEGKSDE